MPPIDQPPCPLRAVGHERHAPHRQLQALWRALDEDNSGFIIAGEFAKFMRKGWHAMKVEQARIKDARTRPIWSGAVKLSQTDEEMKLKQEEQQAERLFRMKMALHDNVIRLEAETARLEKEALRAEKQLRELGESQSPRRSTVAASSHRVGSGVSATRPTTVR